LWNAFEHGYEFLDSLKADELLDQLISINLTGKDPTTWI
jgi:hypothetical protein